MGRKEVEFEVERRKEDRTPIKDVDLASTSKDAAKDAKKDSKQGAATTDPDPEPENWLDNPRMMDNMKYFVFAQSFVMFLTFGLPKMQEAWAMIMKMLE